MNKIETARNSILDDLKTRAKAGDKSVKPLDPENNHRWHMPQPHYYSGSGNIVCPICKTGTLQYQRSAYNGHVWARCSKVGCVAWME